MQWNLSGSGAYLADGIFHFKKMGYKYPGGCFMDNYNGRRIVNSLLDKIPVGISGYDTRIADTNSTGDIVYIYKNGHSWVIDGFLQRKRIVKVYDVVHNNTILVIISLVTYFIVDDFTDSFFLIKETIWRL